MAGKIRRGTIIAEPGGNDPLAWAYRNVNEVTQVALDVNSRLQTVETNYVKKDGSEPLTSNFNAGGNRIRNVGSPDMPNDATTKDYVDTLVSSHITSVSGTADYIQVTELSGREYQVDVDQTFKDRVSTVESWTTDDLPEGSSNLFYSDARVRSAISVSGDLTYDPNTGTISATTYDSVDFDNDFSSKSTDDLVEGSSNLYYSDSRSRNAINAGTGLSYSPSTGTMSLNEVDGGIF